jgi:predicted small metal-binding protein
MSKVLKCSDVNPGCTAEIRGDSEHDVLRKATEHAKNDHNMDSIPPDVLSKVKGAIHDEDEARAQKAGSAN